MTLTREKIASGYLQKMLADNPFGMKPLTLDELDNSMAEALKGRDLSGGVWIFAYGSLLWNPAIHLDGERDARIHGYHRRFCLWTPLGRGSPEKPGLVLGLDRGGCCSGRALRIAPDRVQEELSIVWKREMVTGSYHPRWVTATTPDGPLETLAFVMNRDRPNYAGRLSDEEVARVLAEAEGEIGPARHYLYSTVESLGKLGIHDRPIERLYRRVKELAAEADQADE
ncbi:MAG: gamma-glutamylcyclotransferase [Magnetovibrionaceae bacterium]